MRVYLKEDDPRPRGRILYHGTAPEVKIYPMGTDPRQDQVYVAAAWGSYSPVYWRHLFQVEGGTWYESDEPLFSGSAGDLP